jgi:hypothetical protein
MVRKVSPPGSLTLFHGEEISHDRLHLPSCSVTFIPMPRILFCIFVLLRPSLESSSQDEATLHPRSYAHELHFIHEWHKEHFQSPFSCNDRTLCITDVPCKTWGFHGSDYEQCLLLGYKNPFRTSQETHYVSATESSQLMLCKIWCLYFTGDTLSFCYRVQPVNAM